MVPAPSLSPHSGCLFRRETATLPEPPPPPFIPPGQKGAFLSSPHSPPELPTKPPSSLRRKEPDSGPQLCSRIFRVKSRSLPEAQYLPRRVLLLDELGCFTGSERGFPSTPVRPVPVPSSASVLERGRGQRGCPSSGPVGHSDSSAGDTFPVAPLPSSTE